MRRLVLITRKEYADIVRAGENWCPSRSEAACEFRWLAGRDERERERERERDSSPPLPHRLLAELIKDIQCGGIAISA